MCVCLCVFFFWGGVSRERKESYYLCVTLLALEFQFHKRHLDGHIYRKLVDLWSDCSVQQLLQFLFCLMDEASLIQEHYPIQTPSLGRVIWIRNCYMSDCMCKVRKNILRYKTIKLLNNEELNIYNITHKWYVKDLMGV